MLECCRATSEMLFDSYIFSLAVCVCVRARALSASPTDIKHFLNHETFILRIGIVRVCVCGLHKNPREHPAERRRGQK